ncbi:asparagine synthetase B, partial [Candidatus Woesearchaeota archaeon CG10_big_fil_rev_8_21_14_0_10_30_7]
MCGITGFNWEDKKLLKSMTDVLSHRGPDSHGIYSDKVISLGHRRLAIIDLSKKGHQPMIYEHKNKKVIITYNGEVYNFQEIKNELEKKGY